MLSKTGFAIGLLFVTVAAGCDDDGPTTPTGTTVIIYQDTNFRGDSRALPNSNPNLDDLPGCGGAGADWNDCISSIRIPSGWSITIFDEDNYTGNSATLTADTPDLHNVPGPCGDDWDDCIASIQVRQP
jgi:Peptidase inhibitor family I36